ncbi:Exodeoxyribonuclease VII large subunit [Roseibacterium elongatum DSM 19469]|uniref:Exodeoxyribonuclease VII large subunit n=1 Tax=Roseicyclus elongatus DSM 19469 TaxID=1294273 RepID=W8RT89_9RHOB|nr:Exodeoxyribonuclease VII large subunit [Roseibacterium elongatum DSM 19469]
MRAAADSTIPLISAVGHETDTTLIDHAADRRAPTPTAAAEMAVPVRLDLLTWLRTQDGYMTRAIEQAVRQRGQRLGDLSRALPRPDSLLDTPRQRLDRLVLQLGPALRHATQHRRGQLDRLSANLTPALDRAVAAKRLALGRASAGLTPARLDTTLRSRHERLAMIASRLDPLRLSDRHAAARARLTDLAARFDRGRAAETRRRHERLASLVRLHDTLGYEATLRRGYAVVRDGDAVLTLKAQAETRPSVEIEFADGRLAVTPTGAGPRGPARRTPQKPPPPDQGSLF